MCKNAKDVTVANQFLCWGLLLSGQDEEFGKLNCLEVIKEPNCDHMPKSDERSLCGQYINYQKYFSALNQLCDYYHTAYVNEEDYMNLHCKSLEDT